MPRRDQSSEGRVGDEDTATAAARADGDASLVDEERQPDEFPVTFEEWAAEQPTVRQLAVAGYRHDVRRDGLLLTTRMRAEWQAAFEAFLAAPPR